VKTKLFLLTLKINKHEEKQNLEKN